MKQKAKKYINSIYIDYGDLNYKAEEQIKQAFIDGMSQQLILSGVVKSFYCASELYEDKKCKSQCDSCIALKKLHEQ